MKIVQINAVPYGSTGKIMFQLSDALRLHGHESLCTAGFTWQNFDREDFFITSGVLEKTAHIAMSRLTGKVGLGSQRSTKKLIRALNCFKPDIVHLHNVHGWYVNLPMLFGYIKASQVPVVWTLHDCWSFTGHCPHFEMIACEKWVSGCFECPLYREYPRAFVDCSREMYMLKREWFTGVESLMLVTPSEWLAEKVRRSFLGEYPVRVINNGIDLSVFNDANALKAVDLLASAEYMVLGVAYAWDKKKGLDVVCELATRLPANYRVVLVGVDPKVEKSLPANIVSIRRTQNQAELAQLYSAADVFVNPTREDTFPTVSIEALACGTPVVTFATGGSPEIPDGTCGSVVPKNDVEAMVREVRYVCEKHPYSRQACVDRASVFANERFIDQYLKLYRNMA